MCLAQVLSSLILKSQTIFKEKVEFVWLQNYTVPQVSSEQRLLIVDTFQPTLSRPVAYFCFHLCGTDGFEKFHSFSEATFCDGKGQSFTWKLNV